MKAIFLALLLVASLWSQFAGAQTFDGLYADSPQPTLEAPLQWVAVPKPSKTPGTSEQKLWPAVFLSAAQAWAFQDVTTSTQLPTSPTQDVWMRFTLAPTATVGTWYLRIPRVNSTRVTLFAVDGQGAWTSVTAGNLVAPAQWPLRTRTPTFEIKTNTAGPRTYFISLENQSVMAERPQLLSPIEYSTGDFGAGALIGVLVGTFSLLAVLSVTAYALARNTVFLWLAAFVVSMLFSQLVLLGLAGWQLWPGSQHLNQNMPWATSFVALASGTWLMARASYARDTHPWLYRLLGGFALGSLLLAALTAVELEAVPRSAKNIWTGLAIVSVLGAMAWLTLRGNKFNGWLLLGLVPIGLPALSRVSYNIGWFAHIELAQLLGMLGSASGLLGLFATLFWRSRAQFYSSKRAQALADYDPETGLLLAERTKTRLPRLLLRGSRHTSGSGVILLRWLDAPRYAGLAASTQRSHILRQIGNVMRGASRDIDSLIRHDENHFLILVEGPISRDAMAASASQIMAAALRGTDPEQPAGAALAVNLHIAIWHETMGSTSANNVMALLSRRLNTMGHTTKRRVQFIDSTASDSTQDSKRERSRRKHDVLTKIRKIEGESTLTDLLR